ncbi:energy-coupling factor transporter transmembrane protein EcfT [Alloscardovia omnicolens]|uniref:energy-coupling factor transporter transmembrane component T family protein n=1 Tax=Alloscardovia omnicolens TaxID=419015 RepID=UPI003A62AF9A
MRAARVSIHPFALLATTLMSFSVALFDPNLTHLAWLMLIYALMELCFGMWRQVLVFVAILTPFYLFVGCVTALAYGEFSRSLPIFSRLGLLGLVCLPMFTVSEATLVRALHSMKAPRGLCLAVLISLRFVHVLGERASRISAARRTMPHRNVHLCSWWRLLIPLLDRALVIADDLTHSLELRGFSLDSTQPFTPYKTLRIRVVDYVWIALGSLVNSTAIALWILGIA